MSEFVSFQCQQGDSGEFTMRKTPHSNILVAYPLDPFSGEALKGLI